MISYNMSGSTGTKFKVSQCVHVLKLRSLTSYKYNFTFSKKPSKLQKYSYNLCSYINFFTIQFRDSKNSKLSKILFLNSSLDFT